ncbi:two-component system response regulator GlrR [Pseudohongiella acticola]|jgi:two-component system, NtrC family, response regulator GlrR|uniref:Two-component system response regulator GlrR n=1 Tax=Pseudohongiella acticola TaxID=1524254 RepID=A0A1E8CKF2_9GAMM|nr:sigma 54-interacting transcriptional regulator [Pseudohongiella acticola]OFE12940.1 two-component system response regulator GlrR [Pseudohongiella acticola]
MSDKPRILLVDDDEDLLHLIRMRLQANNLDVSAVDSAEKAITELGRYRPHVVITDLRMPGMDGMALFESIQERFLQLPVIILTAHGTIPDAVAAVQRGVFSYLVKPVDADILMDKITQALSQSSPQDDENGDDSDSWRQGIVSCSQAMETLLQQAKAAARTDVSVLIQSETGTGKELLAKAVHRASNRHDAAFMTLNCAAIPETLLESELFGHTAGAYTGAGKATDGLFKAADKGTVFLDEIGDMPLSAQAKLLRVLEQGEVRPVGSTETIKVDVRILSATHHDLHEKVRAGTFREDLFYRLNVITLEQPRLADRREDIPLLANHFAQQLSDRHGREEGMRFAPDAMEVMVSAPWPGNVRQLLNVVEQCVVLSPQNLIPRQLVERALRFKAEKLLNMNDARNQFEHDYLIRLLNLAEGNIALAARLAERNRSEFYNLLKRHDLDPDQFRKPAE